MRNRSTSITAGNSPPVDTLTGGFQQCSFSPAKWTNCQDSHCNTMGFMFTHNGTLVLNSTVSPHTQAGVCVCVCLCVCRWRHATSASFNAHLKNTSVGSEGGNTMLSFRNASIRETLKGFPYFSKHRNHSYYTLLQPQEHSNTSLWHYMYVSNEN